MCTCLKSNYLLHWGGREFINISGAMWCQYNINSTSWGTLLNWAMFLLVPDCPCRTVSPLERDIHMWVFAGHKVLIQSCSSLGLKVCVVLSSKTIFLAMPQARCAASFGVLVCSAESWVFFFQETSLILQYMSENCQKSVTSRSLRIFWIFKPFQVLLWWWSIHSIILLLCYLIVSFLYFIFQSTFHLYCTVDLPF